MSNLEKWEEIGLLSNVSNKMTVSLALEIGSLYLSHNPEKYSDEISVFIFPVITRLFRNIEKELTIEETFNKIEHILECFLEKFNEVKETQEWINRENNKNLDIEAEFVADFVENFV